MRASAAAESDLDAIWDYTAERWGVEQAESYVSAIRDACDAPAAGRRLGRSIEPVRPGYWKLPVGSHFLCYRLGERGGIEIIRILHQRMDIGRHLIE